MVFLFFFLLFFFSDLNVKYVCIYMFSNWSTRRFVLPFRISRSVLYLSRPWRTFSRWILSLTVSIVSSRECAKSCFNAYKNNNNQEFSLNFFVVITRWLITLSWSCSLSLRSANVRLSSTGSLMCSSVSKSRDASPPEPCSLSPFDISSSFSFSSSAKWWCCGVWVAAKSAWAASA